VPPGSRRAKPARVESLALRHFILNEKSRHKAKNNFTSQLASRSFFFMPGSLKRKNPHERVIF